VVKVLRKQRVSEAFLIFTSSGQSVWLSMLLYWINSTLFFFNYFWPLNRKHIYLQFDLFKFTRLLSKVILPLWFVLGGEVMLCCSFIMLGISELAKHNKRNTVLDFP
jgi:hypothetical protein